MFISILDFATCSMFVRIVRISSLLFTFNFVLSDISVVILVFNAVQNNATILPMFSHHILDHYTYLRNMIPEHVPEIQVSGDGEVEL